MNHKLALLILPCALYCHFTFSQPRQANLNQFTLLKGLPSKISTSVLKDSRGFMWFGTENGLYRYDGYEFIPFQHDPQDSTSISGNMIWSIPFEDDDGDLWIGTVGNGLNIYNPKTGKFRHFTRKREQRFEFDFNQIFAGLQDRDGDCWLASETSAGLIKFDKNTGNYEIFIADTVEMESWNNRFSALSEDSRGILWISTYKGMFLFDKNTNTFTKLDSLVSVPDELTNVPVEDVVEDREGIFWIGSNAGLIRYDVHQNTIDLFRHDEKDPNSLSTDLILNVFDNPLDSGKTLWVITRKGINKLDKLTGLITRYSEDPDDPLNISFDAFFNEYLDDQGILWAATGFSGIVTYDLRGSPFTGFSIGPFDDDPYRYEATTFLHDKEGYFWVGTGYGGLFKYDQHMKLVDRYNYHPDNPNTLSYYFIYSLCEDSDGVLWIGTAANLDVLDKQNNRIIRCTLPEEMNYSQTRINEIYQDSFGILWIAATGGAYYQQKESVLDTSFRKAHINDDPLMEIRCITEDRSGNLWLGSTTGYGLFLLTPENRDSLTFINYRHNPADNHSISDDIVWSLWADKEGYIWCGTTNGLNRFDPETQSFHCFNKGNGLNAMVIYNIKEDNQGDLWLSTESGIVYFTERTDSTAFSQLIETEDGAPFDGNYHFKIYKGPDGKIYVCGNRFSGNGFYCFDPKEIKGNAHIPPVVLTGLTINNKPVVFDTTITELTYLPLTYNQHNFALEFAALDYINPLKNSYAYKLEGFDDDWVEMGNRRLANYTNIPPGDYIFRVKGSNNAGLWNEAGTSLRISVAVPPWKTWWAYTLYALFIIAVFYSILRIYLNRQIILHNLELKQLEAEKLEELHREKSRFFANISHEFRTPLTLIIGPVKRAVSQMKDSAAIQDLQISLNNAFRLQNLINQLLSLAKIESGKLQLKATEEEIVSLVRGYFQSFESAAREKGIELNFRAEPEEIPVYVDREKLEQILFNLISNALKFTPEGGRIAVKVSSQQSAVRSQNTNDQRLTTNGLPANSTIISITNTGPGIALQHLPHLFNRFYQVDDSYTRDQEGTGIGLALVKELVELHHGKITVESEVGKGTTFSVFLPLGKEHLSAEELDTSRQSSVSSQQLSESKSDLADQQPEASIIENDEMKSSIIHHPSSTIHENAPLLLIVEDNRDMRHYLRSCLESGYRVEEAGDGEKGLEMSMELVPDLVISDVMMPKMDGYQLCEKIKSDERTSHIPVILLTALATPESKIEGLETGADDFLSKPFDATELQVRVKNLIGQRRKLSEKFMKNVSRLGLSKILELPETGMASMDEKFLQKSLEIIRQHLSEPEFNVDNLSDLMHMSRSQLYRKIHALTGLAPNEFIRYNRLQKAAELIKHHTGNIAEIAYEVGFNNPSYFSECFKKQFGVLPSEYPAANSK